MTNPGYRLPTDRRILAAMADARRQTSTNLAAKLDLDRRYVTNRLKFLRDKDYLQDPGPADQSRMVEPTTMGRIAIFHSSKLHRNYTDQFDHLCHHVYTCNRHFDERFLPDLIATRPKEHQALQALADIQGLTIPSDFADHIDDLNDAENLLYALYFWSLTERKEGMDVYQITSRGQEFLSLIPEDNFTPGFGSNIQPWKTQTETIRKRYSTNEQQRLEALTRCLPETEDEDLNPHEIPD